MGGEVKSRNRCEKFKQHPTVICRCNDVTLEDVLKALDEGVSDLETLKRRLKIGMGACQGRTCIPIVVGILGRRFKKKPEELMIPRIRAPITPLPVRVLLKSID